ncbi:MAG: tetratricopeptide repeat protein [Armatimonadota bacterium]
MSESTGGSEVQADLRGIDHLIRDGNLRAAQRACKQLLQRHPTSAAAHEKMGDIMYRRELWEDSAEWYDLAIQLADTPELRAKLEDTQEQAREARTGPEPELAEEAEAGRRRLIWLAVGAVAMVVVVILVIVGLAARRVDVEPPTMPRVATAESGRPAGSPGLTAPSTVRGTRSVPAPRRGEVEIPTARENPQQHWAAQEAPRRAPRRPISRTRQEEISEPVTDHDRAVIDAVSSLTWDDDRPMTGKIMAMVDPYTGYAVVRATVPQSLPRGHMVERVVRQAYRVALAAIRADEVIETLTVQMVVTAPNGEHVVLFRGNTDRKTLRTVGEGRPNFATLWNDIFKTTRWNPQVGGAIPQDLQQSLQAGRSGSRSRPQGG